MPVATVLPFLIDARYKLRLTGRWSDGGVLLVEFKGEGSRVYPLPRALFAVMALLILAAKRSSRRGWARAFLTVHEIAALLARKTGLGRRDHENATRLVFRLRQFFATSGVHELQPSADASGRAWSRRLVEKAPNLGYRISLPPRNLDLEILDDPPQPMIDD